MQIENLFEEIDCSKYQPNGDPNSNVNRSDKYDYIYNIIIKNI